MASPVRMSSGLLRRQIINELCTMTQQRGLQVDRSRTTNKVQTPPYTESRQDQGTQDRFQQKLTETNETKETKNDLRRLGGDFEEKSPEMKDYMKGKSPRMDSSFDKGMMAKMTDSIKSAAQATGDKIAEGARKIGLTNKKD